MATAFTRVALMGRRRASNIPETVIELRNFLQTLEVETVIEYHTALAINEQQLPIIDSHDLSKHADLIILVGGDGSLINAAHIAVKQDLPVVGINRGRLGFLTDIAPNELDKLKAVISGRYQIEQRSLLQVTFESDSGQQQRMALNDIVLFPGNAAHMMNYELRVNDQYLTKLLADGLICSTPTGSTAYALSAGGPIIQPNMAAMLIVPMFPHTLTSRPIVLPDNQEVEILISENNDDDAYLSTDGQEKIQVNAGSRLTIAKYPQQLKLVHPEDYNYFITLREKLGWNHLYRRS